MGDSAQLNIGFLFSIFLSSVLASKIPCHPTVPDPFIFQRRVEEIQVELQQRDEVIQQVGAEILVPVNDCFSLEHIICICFHDLKIQIFYMCDVEKPNVKAGGGNGRRMLQHYEGKDYSLL